MYCVLLTYVGSALGTVDSTQWPKLSDTTLQGGPAKVRPTYIFAGITYV